MYDTQLALRKHMGPCQFLIETRKGQDIYIKGTSMRWISQRDKSISQVVVDLIRL